MLELLAPIVGPVLMIADKERLENITANLFELANPIDEELTPVTGDRLPVTDNQEQPPESLATDGEVLADRKPTADSRQPLADRQPIADSRQPRRPVWSDGLDYNNAWWRPTSRPVIKVQASSTYGVIRKPMK
jgi:hypothetical protein